MQWNSRVVTDVVGTAVSIGAMSLALGDDRGESGDEAAAEYLRAVAHEN